MFLVVFTSGRVFLLFFLRWFECWSFVFRCFVPHFSKRLDKLLILKLLALIFFSLISSAQYFPQCNFFLSTIFSWAQYFPESNIFLGAIFSWTQYFLGRNILLSAIFSWTQYFPELNNFLCAIFSLVLYFMVGKIHDWSHKSLVLLLDCHNNWNVANSQIFLFF